MKHEVSTVYLLDISTGEYIEAELWDAITEKQLVDWEAEWMPELFKSIQGLKRAGVHRKFWPQSRHWDWRKKTAQIKDQLGNHGYSIIANGVTEGMMIVDLTKRSRLDVQENQHLVYIEYLENAPWNRKELLYDPPRYRGIGSIMMRVAIEVSLMEGFQGRIGLHSLPQSNSFYGNKCGMSDLGPDDSYHGLHYFEMTSDQAEAFIGRR